MRLRARADQVVPARPHRGGAHHDRRGCALCAAGHLAPVGSAMAAPLSTAPPLAGADVDLAPGRRRQGRRARRRGREPRRPRQAGGQGAGGRPPPLRALLHVAARRGRGRAAALALRRPRLGGAQPHDHLHLQLRQPGATPRPRGHTAPHHPPTPTRPPSAHTHTPTPRAPRRCASSASARWSPTASASGTSSRTSASPSAPPPSTGRQSASFTRSARRSPPCRIAPLTNYGHT